MNPPAAPSHAKRRGSSVLARAIASLLLTLVLLPGLASAADIRVGAAAINLTADGTMDLGGMLESRYCEEQEGELRAVAVVVAGPDGTKVAIVACDVLWIPRYLVDEAVETIEQTTGIPRAHVLVNATHTHHAPSTAAAHGFGVSQRWCRELVAGIVESVQQADAGLSDAPCELYFELGEEATVGRNSRLLLPDGNITWINPRAAGDRAIPTGPFDPQLPVLDFRDPRGQSRAVIFNHSTHTIGTRAGNVRSPSFYGLAAQELETELGGVVSFLEGASGSTHNVTGVPVGEAVERFKRAILDARRAARPLPIRRVAALKRKFPFRVRTFDDAAEDARILRYTQHHFANYSDRVREIFAKMRQTLAPQQGAERETWVQVVQIGDVAIVGVPAEYFTSLGVDIKRRSPFKFTVVAELANDWIGYLPDRDAHRLGGYQTWMGLHSYAEPGTGERMADEVVAMLHELARSSALPRQESPANAATDDAPRTPQQERDTFQLADDALKIELVACEPHVQSPVDIAFDSEGRMIVAEMIGYPETAGQGRISRLTDRDGDGFFEHAEVFADQLDFPSSVLPYEDGILVTAAPDILFLRDTNGDGRADEQQVLWTGFRPGSQQLRVNALTWGPDNWIYAANGRCDGKIRRPGEAESRAIPIRNRDVRFTRGGERLEAIVGRSQFGQVHDRWGRRFLSYNTIPIRQVVFAEPYASSRGELALQAVRDCHAAGDSGEVFPVSPLPEQFNAESAGHYNATCGLTIYGGNALGHGYEGDAFFCESLLNVVTRRRLIDRGPAVAAFRLEQGRDFLASTDGWFHPVNLVTGPDGGLYVVDFYRKFVEHPIYVASAKLRAETDWRYGDKHGRIWRIRHRDASRIAPQRWPANLGQTSTAELVEHLSHPVSWWRKTAQQLIVEQHRDAAAEALRALVREGDSPVGRVHALWTLAGLGDVDAQTVVRALRDPHPRVRENALRLAGNLAGPSDAVQAAILATKADPDPAVRMQLALMLGTQPFATDKASLSTLAYLVQTGHTDRWITRSVLSSAKGQVPELLGELTRPDPAWWRHPSDSQAEFLLAAGQTLARNSQRDCWDLLRGLLPRDDDKASSIGAILLMAGALEVRGQGHRWEGVRDELGNAFEDPRPSVAAAAATQISLDRRHPAFVRRAALAVAAIGDQDAAADTLLELLADGDADALGREAATQLAAIGSAEACRGVFARWNRLPWAIRAAVVRSADRSAAARLALVEAIEQDIVAPIEVPPQVVTALVSRGDAAYAERLRAAIRETASGDRADVVANYEEAASRPGDPRRGGTRFMRHCASCHTMLGKGGRVGPDLSGIAARTREALLVDILDPSRQVVPDFLAFVVLLESGKTQQGLLIDETKESVTLQPATGPPLTIPREEITEIRASGKSLMPDGLERQLDVEAVADLLAFLRGPQRQFMIEE